MSSRTYIDGTIACGKTTIMKDLEKQFITFPENVNMWKTTGIFQKFYREPEKNGYAFQSYAMHDGYIRCPLHSNKNVLIERSTYGNGIFGQLTVMTDTERAMYDHHRKIYQTREQSTNHIIVTRPIKECLKNMEKRGRVEEKQITGSYIEKIQDLHISKLLELKDSRVLIINGGNYTKFPIPVTILNYDVPERGTKSYNDMLNDIMMFIKSQ